MDILKKLGALRKKKTPRTIDDVEFNFYPVRVARILTGDLKEILAPVSDAIQVLLTPRSQDEEILEESAPDGTIARARKPATMEMVSYRADKRKATLNAAMDALMCDETRYKIGRIIMDSLRDDCPSDPTKDQIKQFVDAEEMDVGRFAEFIKGFLAANTAIFGDLGNRIRERMEKVVEKMTAVPVDEEAPLEDETVPAPQPQTTDATNLRALQEEGEVPKT